MAVQGADFAGEEVSFKTTETSGEHIPHHHVDSSALPTGASTAANQATANASLASILAKILAAPATEAKQDTAIASLASILAKIIAAPATEAKQDTQITSLGTLATQATLATVSSTLSTISTGIGTAVTLLTNILAVNTIADAFITSIASANTSANAFSDQAVKGPVHIKIAVGMTGTLTIDDGDSGAVVLQWDDTDGHHVAEAVFYPANMNQLRYTFSVNAGTEAFSVSTAI